MSHPKPINLQNPRSKARPSSASTSRKIVIVLLAVVIVSATIAWFALLGWGIVEVLRAAANALYRLWTTFI